MKRPWLLTAVLAVAVLGLALFVYLKPSADSEAGHALSAITPGHASAIRIERRGAAPIVLEKRGEDWFLVAPLAARADPLQVERLLAIAGAKSSLRLPATDLSRFELDRPVARLTIDAQAFDFGIVSELTQEQYVLTGEAVHAISARHGAALSAAPRDLVAKQLLARGEIPERVAVSGFTVSREEGKWALDPPGEELSQDDLQRWVDDWRHASALRVEPHDGGMPAETVRIQLRGGASLSLGILSREPQTVLLRPDEKLAYNLSQGAARRLLSPPGGGKHAADRK